MDLVVYFVLIVILYEVVFFRAAGPWWGNYMLSIEPTGSTDAPQFTNVLKNHICTSGGSTPTQAPTRASVPTQAPKTTPSSSQTPRTPAPTYEKCQTIWQQCGGMTYTGSTCCLPGNKCVYVNDWYSQCLPNAQDQVAEATSHSQSTPDLQLIIFSIVGIFVAALIITLGVVFVIRRNTSQFDYSSDIPLTED
jgi:hypothetical protein